VRPECPTMGCEEPHRHARGERREPPEDPRLGAVGVDRGRPLAAEQAVELDESEQVVERVDRPAHVAQRHVAHTRAPACLDQEAVAMSGDDDLELLRQRREE